MTKQGNWIYEKRYIKTHWRNFATFARPQWVASWFIAQEIVLPSDLEVYDDRVELTKLGPPSEKGVIMLCRKPANRASDLGSYYEM